MTAPKPATPLPWITGNGTKGARANVYTATDNTAALATATHHHGTQEQFQNAAYIVAACNAYPQLVADLATEQERAEHYRTAWQQAEQDRTRLIEALRNVMVDFVGDRGAHNLLGTDAGKHADAARALLAKLGEAP